MKCPICGQELRPGKKDPNYLLCYNCKKKFKAPAAKAPVEKTAVETVKTESAPVKKVEEKEEPKYSNIPPKKVRDKREEEMRKAYDEMLAAGDTKKKKAQPKKQDEDYDDEYDEDDGVSMVPVIVLGIAIVAVAAVMAYIWFF